MLTENDMAEVFRLLDDAVAILASAPCCEASQMFTDVFLQDAAYDQAYHVAAAAMEDLERSAQWNSWRS